MKIVQATEKHISQAADLFDQYRQFYHQDKDTIAAKNFVSQRIVEQDSVIYLALSDEEQGMGFTQLYPSFSSVAMQRTYILNDLFVSEAFRKQGVARKLMLTAKAFAEKNGAYAIKLATAKANIAAKSLYDDLGYRQITQFDYYTYQL